VTAADTSALIDFSKGIPSRAATVFEKCLEEGALVLPEPVLFEVLSGPSITKEVEAIFLSLPRLLAVAGYWERAALMRRKILKKKLRARAMDCLVAQICIDHQVALITGDEDFKRFVPFALRLA
jgi:predicted nucleic acid-binding protein